MPIKKRAMLKDINTGMVVNEGDVVVGQDSIRYFIKKFVVFGTPNTPMPHLMVVRDDARTTGLTERVTLEFFGLTF